MFKSHLADSFSETDITVYLVRIRFIMGWIHICSCSSLIWLTTSNDSISTFIKTWKTLLTNWSSFIWLTVPDDSQVQSRWSQFRLGGRARPLPCILPTVSSSSGLLNFLSLHLNPLHSFFWGSGLNQVFVCGLTSQLIHLSRPKGPTRSESPSEFCLTESRIRRKCKEYNGSVGNGSTLCVLWFQGRYSWHFPFANCFAQTPGSSARSTRTQEQN